MSLQPVGQMLLTKPESDTEKKTESGIVIPGVNNAQIGEATIVAVSKDLSSVYKAGEKVLYYEKRGVGIIHNNEPHQFINGGDGLQQGDVIAIIK